MIIMSKRGAIEPDALRVIKGRVAVFCRGENDGKIEDMVRGVELDEEVEDLIHHRFATGGRLVDLVYDHEDGETQGEGLFQDEVCLRHGTFRGVHEEQRAVRHLEHPLHLTAEVRVTGGIDDVDKVILVHEGAVLGRNGDAPFLLEVHRIHEPFLDYLVIPEHAALLEQLVDQRRLPVVDMSYDCNIAYLLLHYDLFVIIRATEGFATI